MCVYAPYICVYDYFEFIIHYKELNPTGRWKIVNNEYGINQLYIEHKGWFLTKWIDENDITFKPKRSEIIFDCN